MSERYKIKRLRYTNDSIFIDLYCERTTANFEITYRHSGAIKQYKNIKTILSIYQHNNNDVSLYGIIQTLETRRKEIMTNEKH